MEVIAELPPVPRQQQPRRQPHGHQGPGDRRDRDHDREQAQARPAADPPPDRGEHGSAGDGHGERREQPTAGDPRRQPGPLRQAERAEGGEHRQLDRDRVHASGAKCRRPPQRADGVSGKRSGDGAHISRLNNGGAPPPRRSRRRPPRPLARPAGADTAAPRDRERGVGQGAGDDEVTRRGRRPQRLRQPCAGPRGNPEDGAGANPGDHRGGGRRLDQRQSRVGLRPAPKVAVDLERPAVAVDEQRAAAGSGEVKAK